MAALPEDNMPQFKLTVPSLEGAADSVVLVYEKTSDQFASRLRKVFKERRKWAKKAGVFCYRIYDADLPDYAAAIDLYECTGPLTDPSRDFGQVGERFLYIAEYKAPTQIDEEKARRRFADIVAIAAVVCGVLPEDVFAKVRRRDRGGAQYAENDDSFTFATTECGHRFEINLGAYLDTGLFLDHRDTRRMVSELCAGKRFLNLFAYTGSCTVHAAAGGAAETTTVDLSSTYLEWARRNMVLNGFTGPQHRFIRGDVIDWLYRAARARQSFDVIFVDPPTFSNSKSTKSSWDVQRDHVRLLRLASALLSKQGTIVFSCNLRSFKLDRAALEKMGLEVKDISAQTIPEDYKRNGKIHVCFLITRRERAGKRMDEEK